MLYPGVPEERTADVESCVTKVMSKSGKSKESAIRICRSSIMGNVRLHLEAATEEDLLSLQASLGDDVQADNIPSNAILKFEGACLARAETNKNRDRITDEGVKQLASTIRLMPLTEEHEKKPRGIFTRGYTNEDSTECLVDGFLWKGMFPEFTAEVESGQRKLSIDAEAELAVCSVCGDVFTSALEYCEHIRSKSDKAIRCLFDFTAVAGGAVLNPAGTGTVFPGKDGFTMISHKETEWWEQHWQSLSEIPDSAFADPESKKYPFIDPEGQVVKSAWVAAWKDGGTINILARNLPDGYRLQEGSLLKTSGGNSMDIVCPKCGEEHEITTDAEKLQAELQDKLAELEGKNESLAFEIEEMRAKLEAEEKVAGRFAELAAIAGTETATDALPSLRKMDDEVFETFKTMASRTVEGDSGDDPVEPPNEPPNEPKPIPVGAGDDSPPEPKEDIWNIEVGG